MNTTAPLVSTRAHEPRISWLRRGLSYSGYPLLLLAGATACAYAIGFGLDLRRVVPVLFAGIISGLLLLELLIPHDVGWRPRPGEVARDGVYLLQGIVFGGLGQLIAGTAALLLATGDNGLPLWLAAPLAVVLADLCTYAFHRFAHTNGWLWREHGIHHAPDKVNALNTNTAHFLDILLNNVAAYVPLLVLGFSAPAVFIVTAARAVQTFGAHANIDVRLGWLNVVIMGPEHHRLHHSTQRDEAGNYGTVTTLWDRVFGTFTWAPGRRPAKVGLFNPTAFPAPDRVLASALHPFRSRREPRAGTRPSAEHRPPGSRACPERTPASLAHDDA